MGAPRHDTKVSTKGQVILPKAVRDEMHWAPGTELKVEITENGVLLKPKSFFPLTRHEDVCGMLKYSGPPKTIADMDVAVLREASRRNDRDRY